MPRICPNCATPMRSEVYHGVNLDVCPQCYGVWFDPDELRELLAEGPSVLDGLEQPTVNVSHGPGGASRLLCPDHHVRLQEYHYMYSSPAVLETCPECGGFFVAASEIAKIEQAYRDAHQPLSPKEEAAADLAMMDAATQKSIHRSQAIGSFFTALRQNMPGWWGL